MDFDSIYEEYFDKVFNKVYYMVKNERDAEDIVQEAFISVYKNLSKFEKRSSSYTWIYKIALNKTYDFFRKRKEHFELDEKMIYIENIGSENNILLSQCIKKIDALDQKIVILHDIYGYKFREITKLLDKKLSFIKARYYKSIKDMGGVFNG